MREVLTKSFWQGVKKTYYEALEGRPAEDNASTAPAKDNPNASPKSENPSAQSTSSEQH